jgi:hypothetical protein
VDALAALAAPAGVGVPLPEGMAALEAVRSLTGLLKARQRKRSWARMLIMFSKHDLHEAMGYRLGEMPFDKAPTPMEMRVGLARARYYNTILNRVECMVEKMGLSGEDKYTAIAFYAMLQNESLMNNVMRRAEREPLWLWPPMQTKTATFCGDQQVLDAKDTGLV